VVTIAAPELIAVHRAGCGAHIPFKAEPPSIAAWHYAAWEHDK
jgi:hypothetical protein